MKHTPTARADGRRSRRLILSILALVIAALIGSLGYQSVSSSAPSPQEVLGANYLGALDTSDRVPPHGASVLNDEPEAIPDPGTSGDQPASAATAPPGDPPRADPQGAPDRIGGSSGGTAPTFLRPDQRRALGGADGIVPDGVTVLDHNVPAVANLDATLLAALRSAALHAANDGIQFRVNSGWRSLEYQAQLFIEAVAQYGSEEEAARWVAVPGTSAHGSGDAVDIGPPDAAVWLSQHGADYGLCQIYDNEPWHYELRPGAIEHGCPAAYPDPTYDPRMQR